ncbi:MAG TPA: TetR/AcrR family transcriptional regulator [Streptosporangiaceae bacterium]
MQVRRTEGPLSGRRREAAHNDGEILTAAREVFLADPSAPVSAVAARAKVGISALYRRYGSKDDLLRELARDGLARYSAELEQALADDRDPWTVYADCLTRILDGGSQALAQRLAGTFTPTPDMTELARRAGNLALEVHQRAQQAGVLRDDVTSADIVLLLETLSTITGPSRDHSPALRRRYLALLLQALHAPGSGPQRAPRSDPLPGPAPDPAELAARWRGQPAAGA